MGNKNNYTAKGGEEPDFYIMGVEIDDNLQIELITGALPFQIMGRFTVESKVLMWLDKKSWNFLLHERHG